jgi:hypothetical protein
MRLLPTDISLGLPELSINWGPWPVRMVEKLDLTDIFCSNGIAMIEFLDESEKIETIKLQRELCSLIILNLFH